MTVRAAVVGCGSMGRRHVRCLEAVAGVQVVAVMDPHEASARAVAEEHGVPRAYAGLGALLAAEAPEYVVVASPARYHAVQTIAAFEAGAHVLCEKPLCMSTAEAEAIVDASRRAGRLFTMGFQLRQRRDLRALRTFVTGGGLGPVHHTRVWAAHIMRYPWGRYHHRQDESFGGVMAATVVHYLDAALWVLGYPEPTTVSASTSRRLPLMPDPPISFEGSIDEVSVEDFGHAHVRLSDGSSMSIEGDWLMHPTERGSGFEILGARGLARDRAPLLELEDGDTVLPATPACEPEPENHTVAEHEEFIAAIRGRGEPTVTLEEALTMQRILVAIYESADRGQEVRL